MSLKISNGKHIVRCCNNEHHCNIPKDHKSVARTYEKAEEICLSERMRLCLESEVNNCCDTEFGSNRTTWWINDNPNGKISLVFVGR